MKHYREYFDDCSVLIETTLPDKGRTLVSAERASLWYWDKSKE